MTLRIHLAHYPFVNHCYLLTEFISRIPSHLQKKFPLNGNLNPQFGIQNHAGFEKKLIVWRHLLIEEVIDLADTIL
jgi:hypothetical protein